MHAYHYNTSCLVFISMSNPKWPCGHLCGTYMAMWSSVWHYTVQVIDKNNNTSSITNKNTINKNYLVYKNYELTIVNNNYFYTTIINKNIQYMITTTDTTIRPSNNNIAINNYTINNINTHKQ